MSVKSIGLSVVVGLLLGLAGTRGDDVLPTSDAASTSPAPTTLSGEAQAAPQSGDPPAPIMGGPPVLHHLSDYITGARPDCCGPIGAHGPVDMELYLRNGISVPIEGAIFGKTLETGWIIQGGWKSMFYDNTDKAAWVVDLSISNIHNQGKDPTFVIPLRDLLVPVPASAANNNPTPVRVPLVGVTVGSLNRTFANIGLGREWSVLGTAHSAALSWRVGVDGGGRWGSENLRTHELRHRTDVIGGAWASLHTDVEMPYGAFIFQGGLRFEWDYTWSDVLQLQNNSDLQEINLMLSAGVRF